MGPNDMNAAKTPNTNNLSDPSAIEQALAEVSASPTPMSAPMGAPVKKSGKGTMLGMIIFAILAIGGIGFGVWAMMDGNSKVANLEKQNADLKAQNSQLLEQVAEGGGSGDGGENGSEVPPSVNTEDYIYVGEWGIKIKIPDGLDYVSYTFGTVSDLSNVLYVNGVNGGDDRLPGFADMFRNHGGLGAVSRFSIGGEPENYATRTPSYSDGQYNYYYSGPQAVYSDGDEEKGLEINSLQSIKEMLTDSDNFSKI